MKKYLVRYTFDEEDGLYVAVCPEFFGFIVYEKDLDKLKEECLYLLRIYAEQEDLTGKNIEFEETIVEQELSLER